MFCKTYAHLNGAQISTVRQEGRFARQGCDPDLMLNGNGDTPIAAEAVKSGAAASELNPFGRKRPPLLGRRPVKHPVPDTAHPFV